jgi:lactoylglutathione lyase
MTAAGKITGGHTTGIPVSDQDRALDFYVGTLGFEKRVDADEVLRWPGVPAMFAFRDGDGNGMEIVEQR